MQRLGLLESESLVSAAKSLSHMDVATSCDLVAEAEHVQLLRPSCVSDAIFAGNSISIISIFFTAYIDIINIISIFSKSSNHPRPSPYITGTALIILY